MAKEKEGQKLVHVETKEIPGDQLRAITNNYDAEVIDEDGNVIGAESGVTEKSAIQGAMNKAKE